MESQSKKKRALSDLFAKGVVVDRISSSLEAPADEELIERQLGFRPSNVVSVAARDREGIPTVLRLYPLAVSLKGARSGNANRQPFPTMYWLSCPSLKAAVSQLENQGLISEWEQRLQADPDSLKSMEAAHKSYAEERWSLLSSEDKEVIIKRGWIDSFSTGVAGIVQPCNIKCLHTHFAHYLATGDNLVGKWAEEALNAGKHLPMEPKG